MASFETLYNFNTHFAYYFPKLKTEHESFLFKIKKLFSNSYSILMDIMLNKNESNNNDTENKNLEHVNQSFEIMLKVIELDAKHAAENIFNNTPRNIFRDKFTQVYLNSLGVTCFIFPFFICVLMYIFVNVPETIWQFF